MRPPHNNNNKTKNQQQQKQASGQNERTEHNKNVRCHDRATNTELDHKPYEIT